LIKCVEITKEKTPKDGICVDIGPTTIKSFENIMNEIEKMNMKKFVRYLGYVADEDMPYLYKLSTALVMPTLFESISMPIWEAFYLGCPVVSSNVCALPQQVGKAGLLFDPYNTEDMAEKIYKIWVDNDLRKLLKEKGRKKIDDLTYENYSQQWKHLIEDALK